MNFRDKCELSCDNLREAEPCPAMEGQCVSGCFCPDGLVRNGERCVAPSECRDCACDGLGGSAYVTFDRTNLPFSANCTYVLSRDTVYDIDVRNSLDRTDRKKHTYQVSGCILETANMEYLVTVSFPSRFGSQTARVVLPPAPKQ